MIPVVVILGAAVFAVLSGEGTTAVPGVEPEFNKSQVMEVVERGAGQECRWEEVNKESGRIDCVQEFSWKNKSYRLHDYFEIELVNGTVDIKQ